ncbi:MAG: hypothetical protein O3C28_20380 [Proteobacteria bacterium]|nr:hypothetical protein [Pseudomonadota bacterium]
MRCLAAWEKVTDLFCLLLARENKPEKINLSPFPNVFERMQGQQVIISGQGDVGLIRNRQFHKLVVIRIATGIYLSRSSGSHQ